MNPEINANPNLGLSSSKPLLITSLNATQFVQDSPPLVSAVCTMDKEDYLILVKKLKMVLNSQMIQVCRMKI